MESLCSSEQENKDKWLSRETLECPIIDNFWNFRYSVHAGPYFTDNYCKNDELLFGKYCWLKSPVKNISTMSLGVLQKRSFSAVFPENTNNNEGSEVT